MVYTSAEDFCEKAAGCRVLTRREEIQCAEQMKQGDRLARERLVESYLPAVAAFIRRLPPQARTLGRVAYCVQALEKAVDAFDFLQDSEPFSHRLHWWLRQASTVYSVR